MRKLSTLKDLHLKQQKSRDEIIRLMITSTYSFEMILRLSAMIDDSLSAENIKKITSIVNLLIGYGAVNSTKPEIQEAVDYYKADVESKGCEG